MTKDQEQRLLEYLKALEKKQPRKIMKLETLLDEAGLSQEEKGKVAEVMLKTYFPQNKMSRKKKT